jgi:hypothetical protein
VCEYNLVTQHLAYNEVFWAATAAAAPVIALAAVVLLADAQKLLVVSNNEVERLPLRYALISVCLISATVFSQTIVMLFALISLARHRDSGTITSIVILEPGGLVLVFLTAANNFLGHLRTQPAKLEVSENVEHDINGN